MQDAIGGQSLLSIFSVYEKLKGKSTASTTGPSSATEGRPSTPSTSSKDSQSAEPQQPKATPTTPESESFKSKGNTAMAAKDYPGAIAAYTQALTISPLNPIYLSNRAAAYSASHQHLEAQTDAELAVAADPKYTKAWSRLGLARFALGDAKGSMEAYQKGIEFEGNGGSDAMKKGFETAKRRAAEEESENTATGADDDDDDVGSARNPLPGGAGGMPDLSSLAGMFGGGGGGRGGGGGPDLSAIMNNPMFASMAQNVMSNPEMMIIIMNSFGGGGRGGGEGG